MQSATKCAETLVSSNIRFVWIFAEFAGQLDAQNDDISALGRYVHGAFIEIGVKLKLPYGNM